MVRTSAIALGAILVSTAAARADVYSAPSPTYEAIAHVLRVRLSHGTEAVRLGNAVVEGSYAIVDWNERDVGGGQALLERRPDRMGRPVWTVVVSGGGSMTADPTAADLLARTYSVPRAVADRLVRDFQSNSR